jgi:hypothetical protein
MNIFKGVFSLVVNINLNTNKINIIDILSSIELKPSNMLNKKAIDILKIAFVKKLFLIRDMVCKERINVKKSIK